MFFTCLLKLVSRKIQSKYGIYDHANIFKVKKSWVHSGHQLSLAPRCIAISQIFILEDKSALLDIFKNFERSVDTLDRYVLPKVTNLSATGHHQTSWPPPETWRVRDLIEVFWELGGRSDAPFVQSTIWCCSYWCRLEL